MVYFIKKAHSDGKINDYFQNFLIERSSFLPEELLKDLIKDAELMSSIGINCPEDHKKFFYITLHTPYIANQICADKLSDEDLSAISSHIFKNKEDISTILNFFNCVKNSISILNKKIKKQAYPQDWAGIYIGPSYDINKWLQAMRDIYATAQNGKTLQQAEQNITGEWDKMEKLNFKQWMKFYQEGAHKKYSIAQSSAYVSPDVNGYIIPKQNLDVNDLKAKLPQAPQMPDMNMMNNDKNYLSENLSSEEKRRIIEEQRRKMTARIQAAKRILYSDKGKEFAREEFDSLARKLNELELAIQTVNKRSISSSIFEDLIIKNANILAFEGMHKSANFLYKISQDASKAEADKSSQPATAPEPPPPPPPPPAAAAPPPPATAAPPPPPSGGVPPAASAPGSAPVPAGVANTNPYDQLKKFLNMNSSEKKKSESKKEAGFVNYKHIANDKRSKPFTVNAQTTPVPGPSTQPPLEVKVPSQPAVPTPVQTTTPKAGPAETDQQNESRVDDLLEEFLGKITVQDIINRLEAVSTIFKNREISRQLAIIDMMMDKLGINAYFPSLGEATQKSLESNQYCHTRIEDILSKLRGAVSDVEIIDIQEKKDVSPENADVVENLQERQDKEKARKERRKQEELAEAESAKESIEGVPETLSGPASVEKGMPATATPPAAPTAPSLPATPPAPITPS